MRRWERGRRIHVSWLIALVSLCFVVGVWLALTWRLTAGWPLLLALTSLVIGFWRRQLYVLPLLILGGGCVGWWYGSAARGDLDVYDGLIGHQVTLTGRIKEDPTLNDRNQWVVQLGSITVAGHHLPGSIWASLIGKPELKRGYEITVSGKLEEGFGTFSGVVYTAKIVRVTEVKFSDVGRVVRDWFASAVREAIPEPQASLGIGYLTGQKSALPGDLSDALQIAGLSHIVVASGYNLTILVRLARRVFVKVSKYLSALASSLMIASFVAVTGLSPSMTRAGLVSGLSLLAWYYGRKFHPFVLLPFAAAITVAWQPSFVWGDLGWQLSFSAFAGVMIVAPLMQRFFFGDKAPGVLRQVLGETVAAHIITVPLVLLSFGVVSNVAIIANLLIVPLVPLAMLLTFIAGLTALVLPMAAEWAGLPASWLLGYMTETATLLASLPWAQSHFEAPWWIGIVYYIVLAGACVSMWWRTKFDLRETNVVV